MIPTIEQYLSVKHYYINLQNIGLQYKPIKGESKINSRNKMEIRVELERLKKWLVRYNEFIQDEIQTVGNYRQ